MPGIFLISPFPDNDPNARDFLYEQVPNATEPPLDESLSFRDEIEATNTRIKELLLRSDERYFLRPDYRKYYLGLLGAAKTGLEPPHANLAIGRSSLKGVRDTFLMEWGPKIRSQFIRSLSFVVAPAIGVGLVFGTWSHFYVSGLEAFERATDFSSYVKLIESAAFVLVGIAISMWLSAILRNQSITWQSLAFFDPAQFPPVLRLALVCGLAFVLSVMLLVRWITLGVGPETLNDFPGKPLLSIVIGLVCGLAEDRVSKLVISRFTELPDSKPTTSSRT
jgi:hypothetical protein